MGNVTVLEADFIGSKIGLDIFEHRHRLIIAVLVNPLGKSIVAILGHQADYSQLIGAQKLGMFPLRRNLSLRLLTCHSGGRLLLCRRRTGTRLIGIIRKCLPALAVFTRLKPVFIIILADLTPQHILVHEKQTRALLHIYAPGNLIGDQSYGLDNPRDHLCAPGRIVSRLSHQNPGHETDKVCLVSLDILLHLR